MEMKIEIPHITLSLCCISHVTKRQEKDSVRRTLSFSCLSL
jgi:hypothetical protein